MDRRELRGHRAAVTCLDCTTEPASIAAQSFDHLLASGSEDKTVRIWDTRAARSVKCFHGCFDSELEAVRFGQSSSHCLFAATTSRLVSFDLRKEAVLDSQPISQCPQEFSDISAVAFHSRGTMVAVADDSDCIHLVSITGSGAFTEGESKRLRAIHSNSIGALAFADRKRELVSGGFDFLVCKWDADTFKPGKRAEMERLEQLESSNQTLNPPFVTALQYLPESSFLLAALGDGSMRLLTNADLSTVAQVAAHSAMITSVHAFSSSGVLSGGLDCHVKAWRVGGEPNADQTPPIAGAGGAGKRKKETRKQSREPPGFTSLWSLNHEAKINAVRGTSWEGPFFVSDTTDTISLYQLSR